MEYISCKEVADTWGVTLRTVQLWCKHKRIPGVIQNGKSYLIPSGSVRPSDKRKKSTHAPAAVNLAILMDTDARPRNTFERKYIEYTELRYQGHLEESEKLFSDLLKRTKKVSRRLPILIQLTTLETQIGKTYRASTIMGEVRKILAEGTFPELERLFAVFYNRKTVKEGDLIPDDLLPFFLLRSTVNLIMSDAGQPDQININHLEILGRIIENIGSQLVQAYFHSLLAVASLLTEHEDLQHYHENKAREIILRRRWFTLFAEYYYYLDWHIDSYVKDPEEVAFINDTTKGLFESYIKVANTKELFTHSDQMTPEVLKVAVLKSLGKSTAQIARCMDTTEYFVRKYSEELSACTDGAKGQRLNSIVHSIMWFL